MVCFLLIAGIAILPAEAHHWMDVRQSGLTGPVETVNEEQMVLQPEEKTWTKVPLRNVIYNKDGYAVKVRQYRGAFEFEDKGYFYDENGQVIDSGSFSKEGIFNKEVSNSYDAEHNLTESRYFSSSGKLFLIKRYTYLQGKLSQEIHVASDASVIAVKEYKYDAAGQELEIVTRGQNGTVLARETVGAAGRETDCRYSGELANYGRRVKVKTEAEGRLGEICYLPDGSVYQNQVCEIKEADTVKRTVHRGDGSVASETVYNTAGDVVALTTYKADGSIAAAEKISYQYDAWGNWTERTVLKREANQGDWLETEKTFRQITYFAA